MTSIFKVYSRRTDDYEYYSSLDKDRTALWNKYKKTYYEKDDIEMRNDTNFQLLYDDRIDHVTMIIKDG